MKLPPPKVKGPGLLICSFCGKNGNEVEDLISGPNAYICNECVEVCVEILEENKKRRRDV